MPSSNFVIYVDSEGKMPVLSQIGVPLHPDRRKSHKYWTEYRDNFPVKCNPHPGQTTVWDYKHGKYIPLLGLRLEG